MSYDEFEATVARALHGPRRLYDLFADHPEALDEPAFIDAVARNLSRGRMVVMVLGDGIRSETQALSELLQSHAGAHFTFALVELATWQGPDGAIFAVPSTLAKTVMIERGIVRIEQGAVHIEPVPQEVRARPQSITLGDFWDKMAERDPALPQAIRAFLDDLEPLGVYPDLKSALSIKLDLPERDKPVNFGYIQKNGQFWANPAAWSLPEPVWKPYFETLASLVGGTVIHEPNNTFVAANARSAPRIEQLLPQHHDAWVTAIQNAIRALNVDEDI